MAHGAGVIFPGPRIDEPGFYSNARAPDVSANRTINNDGRSIVWTTRAGVGLNESMVYGPGDAGTVLSVQQPPGVTWIGNLRANAINDNGFISGRLIVQDAQGFPVLGRAMRWGPAGGFGQRLHNFSTTTPDTWGNVGYDIGADNAVYGSASGTPGGPARWADGTAAPTMLPKGTPANNWSVTMHRETGWMGGVFDEFRNGSGGSSYLYTRPARWSPAQTPVELQLPSYAVYQDPQVGQRVLFDFRGMNRSGLMVGWAEEYDASGNYIRERALKWEPGSTAAVSLDYWNESNGWGSATEGVNDAGVIIGNSMTRTSGGRAVFRAQRWQPGSNVPQLLGNTAVGTAYETRALDINAQGFVVGNGVEANATMGLEALLWRSGSNAAVRLESYRPQGSNWQFETATAISDTGFVSGSGRFDADGAGPGGYVDTLYVILVPEAGTYGKGDADFDTDVDFADLLLLAQHYGQSNTSLDVHVADLNLDGVVNFTDLLTLAQNYRMVGASGGPSLEGAAGVGSDFARDWALAQSMVPEPTGLVLLATVAPLRRRRR